MAYNNANNFLIAGNDEHGINPPTAGKRTPLLPYIDRVVYENEFNYEAKNAFLADCLRIGFNILDVKPNRQDASITSRVIIVNRARPNCLITFAYNAFGTTFNNANGIEGFYSPLNNYPQDSKNFAELVYNNIVEQTGLNGRGVKPLDVGMLSSVNTVACLIECGFMTNFNEAKLMLNPDFILTVGRASCLGVCQYLNVRYIPINQDIFPLLRLGSSGKYVKYAQFLLKNLGYSVGSIDGVFGNNTFNAVTAFQLANGLSADGIIGKNTWFKLNNLYPSARTLREGDFGQEVRYLQQLLYSKLYNVGSIDGIFGRRTLQAVKEFQTENGLDPDGIVGKNTWAYLLDNSRSRGMIE